MKTRIFLSLLFLILFTKSEHLFSGSSIEKTSYQFINEPIDVIIPCAKKDSTMLHSCIEGIKKHCLNVNRIIVVSPYRFTSNAEWFDESLFPFSKWEVAYYLNQQDVEDTNLFLKKKHCRAGWYYQQLLKLYASFIIPNISSNLLIVDSDVVFLNPVDFLNSIGGGLYNAGTEFHIPYFTHAKKLIPGFTRNHLNFSGITHHMLFQRAVLEDLFSVVEKAHNMDFWKAFCLLVDPAHRDFSGASEYEIYFNFVLSRSDQINIRLLNWDNSHDVKKIQEYQKANYHYIAFHDYMLNPENYKD